MFILSDSIPMGFFYEAIGNGTKNHLKAIIKPYIIIQAIKSTLPKIINTLRYYHLNSCGCHGNSLTVIGQVSLVSVLYYTHSRKSLSTSLFQIDKSQARIIYQKLT